MRHEFGHDSPNAGVDLKLMESLEAAMGAAHRAEQRLRDAIDLLPEGVVILDAEGRYVLWNKQYADIYSGAKDLLAHGARFEDTLRRGIARGVYLDAIGREEAWLAERLARLTQPSSDHEQRLADGRCILVRERKTREGGSIGLRVDITEMRRNADTLRLLFEGNPVAMLVYEVGTGRIRSANQAAADYFDYPLDELRSMPARALFSSNNAQDPDQMLAGTSIAPSTVWEMRKRNGETLEAVIWTRRSNLDGDESTIVSIIDVTEQRRIERRMAYMARHDELTGLANRAYVRKRLRGLLSTAESGEAITMALVDLDFFKAVNDTYGHHVGDTLLTEVAQRMRKVIPDDALLGRIGGDEFAVIFRDVSRTQVEIISRLMITALSQPFEVQGNMLHIGATIGFASSPNDSSDPETLLRYADLALYAAKGERRGTCRSFEARMDAAAQEKTRLEADLRAAIRRDELDVHYQPIVNLATGALEGFEALVRWDHPERGAISPDVFIPIAEEIGLIDAVGRMVLHTACLEAVKWPAHVKLSVNVSPLQFRNGNLTSTVINALTSSKLPAERLELEITEAVLMESGPRPAAIIRNLRAFGIGISLDDFGKGYSSLSYLIEYPFTKIKIDKSFILNLENESSSRAVVLAVIGLGRSLGLTVTAEGVEREEVRRYLHDEGCMQGQGYLFGRPAPANELGQHLELALEG